MHWLSAGHEADHQRTIWEDQGKRNQRNSCGSESGKGERKQTAKLSTGTWKEGMRNQAGEKGETEEAKVESGTGEATARRNREEKERKKQKAE